METAQHLAQPALTSRKKVFLGFKIAFLGLLNFLGAGSDAHCHHIFHDSCHCSTY